MRLPTLALALALSLPALAGDDAVVDGDLGRQLDAAVQKAGGPDFWGSVLVAKGGKVLLAKGYGSADYAKTPNTPSTYFEIASSSKMFTATAIMRLAEQKKLALTDPISKFFKDVPDDKKAITVRHLLTHTSGLTVEALLPYQSPHSAEEFVAIAMKSPLESKVGEKFAYSNPGYALLGVIIEKASGQRLEKYIHENIFDAAGMKDSGFVQEKMFDAKRASTRQDKETKKALGRAFEWGWGWGYKGMGGMVTTSYDLFRFDRAMRAGKILNEASQKAQATPEQAGYGLGCQVAITDRGTTKIGHSGSVAGYLTAFTRWLGDDAVVIVLSNDSCNPFAVEAAAADLLFPPLAITLDIDIQGRETNEHGGLVMKEGASWKASKTEDGVVLSVETKAGAPLKATFPGASSVALLKVVEDEIARRTKAGEKDDGSVEFGVYTGRLGLKDGRGQVKGAKFELMPGYTGVGTDGKDINDPRMCLIFADPATHQWPLMAHMSLTSAGQLAKELKGALGR